MVKYLRVILNRCIPPFYFSVTLKPPILWYFSGILIIWSMSVMPIRCKNDRSNKSGVRAKNWRNFCSVLLSTGQTLRIYFYIIIIWIHFRFRVVVTCSTAVLLRTSSANLPNTRTTRVPCWLSITGLVNWRIAWNWQSTRKSWLCWGK